jgi:hypothetical protein
MYVAGVASDRIDKSLESWENRAARKGLNNQDTLTSILNRSAVRRTGCSRPRCGRARHSVGTEPSSGGGCYAVGSQTQAKA